MAMLLSFKIALLLPSTTFDSTKYRLQTRMDLGQLLVIHEVLSSDILVMIFEEHAKSEWRAPIIDGRVCRIWRQIVLNAPRAWSYLEIRHDRRPSTVELRSWLQRSGAAPLHIRAARDFMMHEFFDLLSTHHTRIASLRMSFGSHSFFEGRDFPRLQLLAIESWNSAHSLVSTVPWGLMPDLRSLHLGHTNFSVVPSNALASLKVLVLHDGAFTSFPRQFRSLTTLMLVNIPLDAAISGNVDFPALTYLSLYGVLGLKSLINAPYLATYHEGGAIVRESFSAPVPSLVEYGVYDPESGYSDPAVWHIIFPNILKVSIRAFSSVVIHFLNPLSTQPDLLPALQVVCASSLAGSAFEKESSETMESLVRVRNEACHQHVELCFDASQIPLFFARVSHREVTWSVVF